MLLNLNALSSEAKNKAYCLLKQTTTVKYYLQENRATFLQN